MQCLVIGFSAILCTVTAATLTPATAADGPLKIGMVQSMFRDVQPTVVQALARPFRSLMEKQTGLIGDIEICPDGLTMGKKIQDQKLEIGVFPGHEFSWAKTRYTDLVPLTVAVPQGKIVQAHIIVHADSKAKKVADLEGEAVILPRGVRSHCLVYLDKMRAELPKTTAKPLAKPTMTPEEALNAVATGEQTAVLVDAASYTGYQNLQPGAAKQLRVLCTSEEFPQTIVAYRKGGVAEPALTRLKEGLTTAHKTAQYKPLMMMWNLQGFEEVPGNYDEQLKKCRELYPVPATLTSTQRANPD